MRGVADASLPLPEEMIFCKPRVVIEKHSFNGTFKCELITIRLYSDCETKGTVGTSEKLCHFVRLDPNVGHSAVARRTVNVRPSQSHQMHFIGLAEAPLGGSENIRQLFLLVLTRLVYECLPLECIPKLLRSQKEAEAIHISHPAINQKQMEYNIFCA